MKDYFVISIAKIIQKVAKIKGGGSAAPGLFLEKTGINFLQKTLGNLPHGVVVVSGTNGKTTTTKMVVEMLESQNLRVFTNKTGSNFVRGVMSAALEQCTPAGEIKADIAVLELDEAHAIHFIDLVKPRYSLLLNVMRDQLDRFGEIDYTAKLLQKIGDSTTDIVVTNARDPLLSARDFSEKFAKTVYFGFDKKLEKFFPTDEEIHGEKSKEYKAPKSAGRLANFTDSSAEIKATDIYELKPKITGVHNLLNLTAALVLVEQILQNENLKVSKPKLIKCMNNIKPAFGRGEIVTINSSKLEIMLVKNPAGFRSNLMSTNLDNKKIMIAINDNPADGRDMSWLWDVDFSNLKNAKICAISGIRAYDMALRLMHDNIDISPDLVNTDITETITNFISIKGDKKIFATYTAMLKIRAELAKNTDMEKIL